MNLKYGFSGNNQSVTGKQENHALHSHLNGRIFSVTKTRNCFKKAFYPTYSVDNQQIKILIG